MTSSLWPLALSWLAYFCIHSLLASIVSKQFIAERWPGGMPAYRLAFNIVAVLLLVVPLGLTLSWSGPWVWQWQGIWLWFSLALTLLAIAGFLWSLKYYDMDEFLGLRQLSRRIASVDDQERFHLSPLHRWVRHPWYFFALLLIWTRDMHAAMLLSAVMMTLYFFIGSWFEERKLIRYHGEQYRRYRELVPGLIPLPWKYLRKEQMRELLEDR
jgi:protein-S-isoprenylcysteine O-methyltransferase Ste14